MIRTKYRDLAAHATQMCCHWPRSPALSSFGKAITMWPRLVSLSSWFKVQTCIIMAGPRVYKTGGRKNSVSLNSGWCRGDRVVINGRQFWRRGPKRGGSQITERGTGPACDKEPWLPLGGYKGSAADKPLKTFVPSWELRASIFLFSRMHYAWRF